ncbi:MAG: ribosomal protein S18-alanine N-acetyltransferase [Fimbriimonadaceae bacterium]
MSKIAPRPSIRFEPLAEHHLPAIVEIEKATNTAPWSERSFRHEISNPHAVFIAGVSEGKVVGYGGIWLVVDEAHVTTIAIEESLRRQGAGRKLMVELLRAAQEKGLSCSTLEVRASNEAAIKLYETLGYVQTARRRSYYPDNREDAIVMWLHGLQNWEPAR